MIRFFGSHQECCYMQFEYCVYLERRDQVDAETV
jgi:hypothetical protein